MQSQAAKPDPVTQTRARVLVIDDDPLFRNLLSTLLRRDYLVMVASDGMDGFRRAKDHPPDIAVIDVQMPGWDGIQTLQEFRKHPALRKVGTIMLTADATRDTVITAIQHGANDYVIKSSFSREEFFSKIGKLVRRLRGLAEKEFMSEPDELASAPTNFNESSSPSSSFIPAPQFATPKPVMATTSASSTAGKIANSPHSEDEFFAPAASTSSILPPALDTPAPVAIPPAPPAAPADRLRELIDNWE